MPSNTFKSVLVENLSTKAEIYATPITMKTGIVSLFISSKTTSLTSVSVIIRRLGIDHYISKAIPLPAGATFQPTDGTKIFLMPGDYVFIEADHSVDVIFSFIEDI